MASACGRPPACVQPRPITTPSLPMIAPTAGLGRLSGLPRSASRAAPASQRRSAGAACNSRFRLGGSLLLLGSFLRTLSLDLRFHRIDIDASGAAQSAIHFAFLLFEFFLLRAQLVLLRLVGFVRGDNLRLAAIGCKAGDESDLWALGREVYLLACGPIEDHRKRQRRDSQDRPAIR